MSILAQEEQGGSAVRRIGQEVQKSAHERCLLSLWIVDCLSHRSKTTVYISLWFVSQRTRCQSDHAGTRYSSSLPSRLPGAGSHVVQRSPESCRYHSPVQDVQQHGPSSCGAGEDQVQVHSMLVDDASNCNVVYLVLRSEYLPSWIYSCSLSLSLDQRSTKTINTSTSTSWLMLPVLLKPGKRYKEGR